MICSGPGMRQLSVADQDAEAAVVEKGLVHAGNAVDDAGKADRVVRPAPLLAGERKAGRDGAVDIGEFVGLDVAVRPAGADESAEIGRDLLLEIDADAAAALILADRGDIGRAAGDRANAIASAKLPMRPRLRNPVTAILPGCPHRS